MKRIIRGFFNQKEKFTDKFWAWTNTKIGRVFFSHLRPWVGFAFCWLAWSFSSVLFLKIAFTCLWLIIVLPDLAILYPFYWVFSKVIGFGRFKPGDLLVVKKRRGKYCPAKLYSTDLYEKFKQISYGSSVFTSPVFLEANEEQYSDYFAGTIASQVTAEIVYNNTTVSYTTTFNTVMKKLKILPKPDDVLLVVEQEELGKNPFWMTFLPFKKGSGRVKIFFETGTYWANPKFLTKLRK